jgi:hypothetical protein
MGYKPIPAVGNLSEAYTNPLGVNLALHVLRLLRVVRMCELFEGESSDDNSSCSRSKPGFEARTAAR